MVITVAAAACAAPPIRLTPVFREGDTRGYRLVSDATTTIDVPGTQRVERTFLEASSQIEVLSVDADGARLRLTLRPLRFERDGVVEQRPDQEVQLIVGPNGAVRNIETVGGIPADLAPDAQELAPLLGIPLPEHRLRLGERWRVTLPPVGEGAGLGEQTGRVAALRVVRGVDSVVVRLGAERPITRQRTVADRRVALRGTESSTTELAFALREGYPVRIETDAEGHFQLVAGDFQGGSVIVRTTLLLELSADDPG